jgi:hypothetical protein
VAHFILTEEDMSAFLESAVCECSWGGVAGCRNWSEAGHVLAELGPLGWYSELVARRGSLRVRRTPAQLQMLADPP